MLDATGCDAVMIGRAAQGRPWIFRPGRAFLAGGELLPETGTAEVRDILLAHPNTCMRSTAKPRASASRASTWAGTRLIARKMPHSATSSTARKARKRTGLTRDYFDSLPRVAPGIAAAA